MADVVEFSPDLGRPNPFKPVFRDPPSPGLDHRVFMNYRMWAAWDTVIDKLGFAPTIVQGAYMLELGGGGAKASQHAHDFGGCIDTRTTDLTDQQEHQVIKVARSLGWAVWKRLPPDFDEHMHWVLLGDTSAHFVAKGQMEQYTSPEGGNGLVGAGPDPHIGLRPDPIVVFDYDKYLEDTMDINEKVPRKPDDNTVGAALRASIRLEKAFNTFREREAARDRALRLQVQKSQASVRGRLDDLEKAVENLPEDTISKAEMRQLLSKFLPPARQGLISEADLKVPEDAGDDADDA